VNKAIIPAAFGLGVIAVLLSRDANAGYSHSPAFTADQLTLYTLPDSTLNFPSNVKPAIDTGNSGFLGVEIPSLFGSPQLGNSGFDWGSWAYEVEPWGQQTINVEFYPPEDDIVMPIGKDDLIEQVAGHLQDEEGFRPYIYDDVNGKPWSESKLGNPTIGFGHLVTAADVKRYGWNWEMDENEAYALLLSDVNSHLAPIIPVVKVPLSLNQWVAIASLAFNAGPNGVKNSKFIAAVNRGDLPAQENRRQRVPARG